MKSILKFAFKDADCIIIFLFSLVCKIFLFFFVYSSHSQMVSVVISLVTKRLTLVSSQIGFGLGAEEARADTGAVTALVGRHEATEPDGVGKGVRRAEARESGLESAARECGLKLDARDETTVTGREIAGGSHGRAFKSAKYFSGSKLSSCLFCI